MLFFSATWPAAVERAAKSLCRKTSAGLCRVAVEQENDDRSGLGGLRCLMGYPTLCPLCGLVSCFGVVVGLRPSLCAAFCVPTSGGNWQPWLEPQACVQLQLPFSGNPSLVVWINGKPPPNHQTTGLQTTNWREAGFLLPLALLQVRSRTSCRPGAVVATLRDPASDRGSAARQLAHQQAGNPPAPPTRGGAKPFHCSWRCGGGGGMRMGTQLTMLTMELGRGGDPLNSSYGSIFPFMGKAR